MIYLKRMLYRKWITLFFSVIFITLFVALPFGFYQSREAHFIISEAIEEVDRGSYDLLVRPGTTTDRETNLKMVDLSYATHQTTFNGFGIPEIHLGFTKEEWQTIANDPRVEISAPIATLGFMDSMAQSLVLPKSQVAGDYRYQVEFYTTDGLSEYSLSIADKVFKEEVELKWQLPTTSHLLVGIDPESEQKLTGIDFQPLLEPAQAKETFELAGSDKIRVMQRQGLTTPLKVRIERESLEDNLVSTLFEGELTDYLQPFSGGDIQFLSDGSLEVLPPSQAFNQVSTPYLLSAPMGSNLSDNFDATPQLSVRYLDGIPSYRSPISIEELLDSFPAMPWIDGNIETFDPSLVEEYSLTGAPLGIYSIPDVQTEVGEVLIPSARAGSFISQTASGVTTLEAIESIRGPYFIDAIRLKVAADGGYTPESRELMKELTRDLRNMQYDVSIVAGSALERETIYVEDIGYVSQPLVKIGVLASLVQDFNVNTFTTISLFSIFALTWIFSRLKAEKSLLQEEREILAHIGWTEWQLKSHDLISQQIFLVLLNGVSLVILWLLEAPGLNYLISLGLLLFALMLLYLLHGNFRLKIWSKPFQAGQVVTYYWEYYQPLIILLWVSYQVIAILTASQYRVIANFNGTTIGQTLISPVNSLMLLLLLLAYIMTIMATFESLVVILQERKDELILYQLVGWKRRTIYFHLVKEAVQWLLHPLLSAAAVATIISILLSFILGGTLVALILGGFIIGCLYLMLGRRIQWTSRTWNWTTLGVLLLVSIFLGRVYSPSLVLPILYINLAVIVSISSLILVTIYLSLKKFYQFV